MDVPTPKELKRKRKKIGLTQSDLADKAGVSQPLIARIENGDVDPRLSTLNKIVEVINRTEGYKVTAQDLMSREIEYVEPDDTIRKAVEMMQRTQFSQLPVLDSGIPVGSTSDALIAREGPDRSDLPDTEVREVMGESFPTIPRDADIQAVSRLLEQSNAVLVTKEGEVEGIITDADLAAYVGSQ